MKYLAMHMLGRFWVKEYKGISTRHIFQRMLNLRSYSSLFILTSHLHGEQLYICSKTTAPNSAGVLEFVGTAAAHAGLPGLCKILVAVTLHKWATGNGLPYAFATYSDD